MGRRTDGSVPCVGLAAKFCSGGINPDSRFHSSRQLKNVFRERVILKSCAYIFVSSLDGYKGRLEDSTTIPTGKKMALADVMVSCARHAQEVWENLEFRGRLH